MELSIELPEGEAAEIAEGHVIHWTGSEWEYLDTVVRGGWAMTAVSSLSRFSVGYRAHIGLQRNAGTMEYGRLEVERRDDGTEVVVLYSDRGETINESKARDYRGGILYHFGEMWTFGGFADLIREEHIGLSTFHEALATFAASVTESYREVTPEQSASLTLFPPREWTTSCSTENAYGGMETTLGLRYRQGRFPYWTGTGGHPQLFVEVTQAENLLGDYLYLIFYSGSAPVLRAKLKVRDVVPGRQYQLELPLTNSQIPVADPHLVALTVGQPNIPWSELLEARNRRLLCAYARQATSRESTAANYYVDSVNGSDANPGTSKDEPWQTLAPVHARDFVPGDVLLFKRGSSWTGGLIINDSGVERNPITLTSYGTGDRPIFRNPGGPDRHTHGITITADWVVVEGLRVEDTQREGIYIDYGADHNIVRDIEATNVGIGIGIRGQHNLATHNYIHDLHMVVNTPGGRDDFGAVGIWFFNSNNEASYNRMENCRALSYDFGLDGGVFEFYGIADNIYFHHNWGSGCNFAFEVSGGSAKNNIVAYNVFVNNGGIAWLHLQGALGSDVKNFRFENNVVVETLGETQGPMISFNGTPSEDTFLMRNNILYVDNFWFVFDESDFTHNHNLYHLMDESTRMSQLDTFIPGEGELFADPLFADAAGGDFHLQAGSPAIDAAMDLGYSRDYDDRPVPVATAPDIGAYEYPTPQSP